MSRVRVFVLLSIGCVLASAVAVTVAVLEARPGAASSGASAALATARDADRSVMVFRSLASDTRDQIGIVPVGAADDAATLSGMRCERVHFNAGRGLCIARGGGFAAGYHARIFGSDLRVRHELELAGIPSRARVSRDGRVGAVTMFVSGHSYAAAGAFSTQTTLLDLRSGAKIADLETFVVARGQKQVTAVDRNFWGVTFARDSDRFYATMATGGRTYLVEGSVSRRTARVIHDNVECPSLSPDGRRIAYKRRTGSSKTTWRLTVLDLDTMRETPLAETRSVDDQAEWLDGDTVLYGRDGAIWSVPADGTGAPERFIAGADSPAVVRN